MPVNHPKIALIVDNPARDLDGLTLLARELCGRRAQAMLVPMYTQGYAIARLAPDIVVVNYLRPQNIELIRQYSRLGIGIVVLETEGGVWESDEQYLKTVSLQACCHLVDRYLVWGERQRSALVSSRLIAPEKVVVTGNPRFDFYSPRLRGAIAPVKMPRPYVLAISSSPLAAPRFGSVSSEKRTLISLGYSEEQAAQRLVDDIAARKQFIAGIKELASNMPEFDVVVRPHPFESDVDLRQSLIRLPNVYIDRSQTVAPWLAGAQAIIHITSSAAIDAYLLGKISINMGWAHTESLLKKSSITLGVSASVTTPQELVTAVRRCSSEGPAFLRKDIAAESIDAIEKYYGTNDGRAVSRVCDSVLELNSQLSSRARMSLVSALTASRNRMQLWRWADGLSRWSMGALAHNALRTSLLRDRTARQARREKFFSHRNVMDVMQRLENLDQKVTPQVKAASSHLANDSILISA